MNRYLYRIFVALFAVMSLSLVSCSSDDEDEPNNAGAAKLKVNGVEWIGQPLYNGDLSETDWTNSSRVFCKFTRNEKSFFPSYIRFDISMDVRKGHGITKGMDLATSEYLIWGGGNNEYDLSIGAFGEDDYIWAIYGGRSKVSDGSAVVMDFKDKDFLTIKFSNYKLPLEENSFGNASETLTLDGTITFKYTDSLLDAI